MLESGNNDELPYGLIADTADPLPICMQQIAELARELRSLRQLLL